MAASWDRRPESSAQRGDPAAGVSRIDDVVELADCRHGQGLAALVGGLDEGVEEPAAMACAPRP
jgi:hypothetical protein